MVIYMKHPQHGTKVAICEEEAIYDESNGWLRFDPALKLEESRQIPSDIPPVVSNTLRVKRPYNRRTA